MKTAKTRVMLVAMMLTIAVMGVFAPQVKAAVDAASVKVVGDKEAEYLLVSMERLKGKAILFPEVYAMQGLLRYAQATGNTKITDRVAATNAAPDARACIPNWTHAGDSITLRAEVLEAGDYELDLHCSEAKPGTEIEISFAGQTLRFADFKGPDHPFTILGRMKLPKTGPTDLVLRLVRPASGGEIAFNMFHWIAFSRI